MKLTRRGNIVVFIIIVALWVLAEKSVPKGCDVPVSKMSQSCKEIVFPN